MNLRHPIFYTLGYEIPDPPTPRRRAVVMADGTVPPHADNTTGEWRPRLSWVWFALALFMLPSCGDELAYWEPDLTERKFACIDDSECEEGWVCAQYPDDQGSACKLPCGDASMFPEAGDFCGFLVGSNGHEVGPFCVPFDECTSNCEI